MSQLAAITAAPPLFATVPVHGREILAAQVDGAIRVPMRGFCAAIGLPWEPQRKRIQRDELLREGASMMEVPSAGGAQQQVTLPAELIPGFLFGVDHARVAPELRDVVRLFRREAYAALHAHFAGLGSTVRPADLAPERAACAQLVSALAIATHPQARRLLHAMLAQSCAALGMQPPLLAAIGMEAPSADALIDRLFEAGRVLEDRRIGWNHIRPIGRQRAAIVLPELARQCAAQDIDMPVDLLRVGLEAGSTSRFRFYQRALRSAIAPWPKLVFAWVIEDWRP